MRHGKFLPLILLAVSCLMMTGCSELYVMTEAEEEQIVVYSAKIVSKYNRAQDNGYSYVDEARKETLLGREAEAEEEESEEGEEVVTTVADATMSEAIGITGLEVSFVDATVTDTYTTTDIAIPDPAEGQTYYILNFTLTNASESEVAVDLLQSPITYTITLNGTTEESCISTLSMSDLSTFYQEAAFAPGESVEASLVFEIDQTLSEEITSVVLHATRDGSTYDISIL